MISVVELTKRFGSKTAVNQLTFDVHPGVVTGFLGPNGSGKSTTMRCILGLDRPDGGGATVDGKKFSDMAQPLHHVGALLDAGYVNPGRSARNHLRWQAAAAGIDKARVDVVLDMVGLTPVAGQRVKAYSLGMRQRLGLAGVLLGDPQTVILDEPANGLDPEGIRWIRDILTYLAGQGRTVLVSSHLLNEMALMASDLVVIGQGHLIDQTTVADFVDRYADRWVHVESPQAAAIASAASAGGAEVTFAGPTAFDVRRITCADVGEIAGRVGAVVHELSPHTGSLEDAYLAATAAAQEYVGRQLGGDS